MNFVSYIMVVFSLIAAIDRIFGSRLGLGKEFDKGFMLLGTMSLSMIGMIVISPLLADLLNPLFETVYNVFGVDPSVIPAIFFANDMGDAPLYRYRARWLLRVRAYAFNPSFNAYNQRFTANNFFGSNSARAFVYTRYMR